MFDKKKPRDMMRFFKRMVVLALVLWTAFSFISMAYHVFDSEKLVTQLAYQAAQQSIEKENIYRLWASEHGGVYVPVSQKTPPNQYLSYVAERDITTLQGKRLTLVNPAYMTRQVHELMAKNTGVKGHITSLNPIRAENRPDEWEAQALKKIEGGAEDFGEVTTMDGVSFYRLMIPLRTEGPCLKCHAAQGYKSGDIRGGISAAVPMERFDAIRHAHIIDEVKHFGSVWFLGVAGIFIGSGFVKQRIDERDSAEKSLRESEGKYRSLFVNNPVPMLVFDAETLAFLAVNDFAVDHYGYSREEFMSMTIKDIRPPEDIPHLQKVLKEEAGILRRDIYARHRKKDGSLIDVEIAAHEIDFEGHSAVLVLATDITERKLAEEKLRDSEQAFQNLFNNSEIAMFRSRVDGTEVLNVNDKFLDLVGLTRDEVIGKPSAVLWVDPSRRDELVEILKRDGRVVDYEFQMISRKRGVRDCVTSLKLYPKDGILDGSIRDITEHKRTEETIRRSEVRLREAEKIAKIGNWEYDCATHTLLWSDEAYSIFGIDRTAGITFDAFIERIHPEDRDRVLSSIQEDTRKKISPWEIEYRVIREDGNERYVHESARFHVNEAGHELRRGTVQDITERKRAEAALRDSEKMLRTIIDSEPECVKLVSPEGLLIEMNPAGLAMIEADSLDMVKGQPLVTFVTEPHREAFNRLGVEVFSGKEGRLEFEIVGLKGRRLWMETHAVPLRDEKDSIFAMLAITRDITERKKAEEQHKHLEEQLMHAHKMEAVGQLAGGVAHDFNNILTSVLGCAELLQMNIDRNSPQKTYVDYILESARRGVSLVRGLLVFSRKDVTYPLPLDLGRAVDESRPFMEKTVSENYQLLITHQDDLVVMADRHQMEQVLINLVSNARDAMPSGGTISIGVAPAEFKEDYEFEGALMKAGRYALLMVADTGIGIDDRVKERVFEPFFTTKDVGKGTGLGLSIVYGIVKQHGGFIRLLSTPGAGTTVQVYLPLIEEHKEKDRLGDEQLPRGGDETILLAEDDAIVREITSNLLREFGYTVLVASNGLEAVNMFTENKNVIKLLILDVIMPEMSGREVYEKVREVWPEAKTLMMSGYSGDHLEGLPSESETLRFLEKPVSPSILLSEVRSMLGGKESSGSATLT